MNKKIKFYSGLFLFSILFVVVFSVFTPTDKSVALHYSRAYSYANSADDLRMTVERDGNPLETTTYQVAVDSIGNIDTIGVGTTSHYVSFAVNLRKCSHTTTPPFI